MVDTVKSLSILQATKILKTAIEGIVLQPCHKQDNPDPANVIKGFYSERCNPSGRTGKMVWLTI